jgi:hypothetical protein
MNGAVRAHPVLFPQVPGTFVPVVELPPANGRSHCMKQLLLAVSALAIVGPEALTSANASQGAYVGDCRVIRERIETRRTGQVSRLRVIIPISVKAAIPTSANAGARRNNGAANGSRAFAAEPAPLPRSASTPVPMSSPRPASDAGQSEPKCQVPCE